MGCRAYNKTVILYPKNRIFSLRKSNQVNSMYFIQLPDKLPIIITETTFIIIFFLVIVIIIVGRYAVDAVDIQLNKELKK